MLQSNFSRFLGVLFLMLVLVFTSACSGKPKTNSAADTSTPISRPTAGLLPPRWTSTPPSEPTVVPELAVVEASDYLPLSPGACGELATAMSEALDDQVQAKQAPFLDFVSGTAGTSCQMTALATGPFFKISEDLRAILGSLGWHEDNMYSADGPLGTAKGFRSDGGLCLFEVNFAMLAEGAICPTEETFPYLACELTPDQFIFDVVLSCARQDLP